MNRVLLVDDEVHSVRGLQAGVRWENLDISEVYTAHSLRQAQEVFENEPVDLMICDIEMPQGTGLELLAWVRENRPQTETIFLTCHSDFAYAKQAIQLGSFDYLLKPVDYTELETVMSKALGKIKKEEKHKRYAQMWESHRPLRKERFWKDVVEQTVPSIPDKIDEYAERHHLSYTHRMRFLPLYIHIQNWHKQLSQREQKIMEYALRNAAEEKLTGDDPEAAVILTEAGSLLVILPFHSDDRSVRFRNECQEYVDSCRRYFNCDLICYIGHPAFPQEMAGMLRKLQEIDRSNVTIANRALLISEVPKCGATMDPPPLGEWAEWMKQGAKDRLEADVDRYLGSLREGKAGLNAAGLHRVYQDFLQMVFYVLQLKGLQANEVFSENLLTDKPEAVLKSIQAFQEWTHYVIEVAISRLYSTEGNLSIVERVKRYISVQLGEHNLSREEIANYVYLNPDYLTRLFKKETGMAISDYLQQQRIEYAKGYLERSDQPISEIAVASGYSNLSYFSTIFKKATGCTPADYRKSCHRK